MQIRNLEFENSLEDILDELRSELHANGINLLEKQPVQSGHNYQCQCIYHGDGQERKPSMGIDANNGIVHCFACGEVKDFPEFVSNCFGKNDSGAFGWSWLIKNFMAIEAGGNRNVKLNITRDNNSREYTHNVDAFVSEDILDTYRYEHPYWAKRGITDEDIIELFDLGYDKKTDCITFPVRNRNGDCLFVARRNVKTKFFNYPEGVKKPLYGLYELTVSTEDMLPERVIVCESMIDCILLWQYGYYAVALNGLGNEIQMKQLRDLTCRTLIIATDNDDAGWKAYDRIKANIHNKLIYRLRFPKERKDIGEMTAEEIKALSWYL